MRFKLFSKKTENFTVYSILTLGFIQYAIIYALYTALQIQDGLRFIV